MRSALADKDFFTSFPVSQKEVQIGISVFLFIFFITFGSRFTRLTSGYALRFMPVEELKVPEKISLDGFVQIMKEQGLAMNEKEFIWAAHILGWRHFQKGFYKLEGNYSYEEFFSKVAKGIQDPVPFTILPGITLEKFAENAETQLLMHREDLLSVMSDSSFLKEYSLTEDQLFGRMLPETYLVYWTISPKELVNRVLKEFDAMVVKPNKDRAKELGISLNDIVALASIVEWEAHLEEEKPIISGLYWNRLNKGMKLQADPTINFALGERRRLLFEDYKIDHPYNTYMHTGLPPGPITNPTLSSIKAALFPVKHGYLYMVANPEGGHVFSKTYEQHEIESEKWRTWLQKQYRIKRQKEREYNK